MSYTTQSDGSVQCITCKQLFMGKLTDKNKYSHERGNRHLDAQKKTKASPPQTQGHPKARNETIQPRKTATLLLKGKLQQDNVTLSVEIVLEVCQRTGEVHVRSIEHDS